MVLKNIFKAPWDNGPVGEAVLLNVMEDFNTDPERVPTTTVSELYHNRKLAINTNVLVRNVLKY